MVEDLCPQFREPTGMLLPRGRLLLGHMTVQPVPQHRERLAYPAFGVFTLGSRVEALGLEEVGIHQAGEQHADKESLGKSAMAVALRGARRPKCASGW